MNPKSFFIAITCAAVLDGCNSVPPELHVMSFNIWGGGGTSVALTASVISGSGADIVGIQEPNRGNSNSAEYIADSLGWYSYSGKNSGCGTIISRYAVTDTSKLGYGVKIRVDARHSVWMFNIHLYYCPYEPYQLGGIEYCGAPLLATAEEAIASAWTTRSPQVTAVVEDIQQARQDEIPVFLTGDFNEPSFLDWTERAATAGMHRMTVMWPSTKAFTEQAGMADSYRAVFPNEIENPGYTWTPRPATKEIHDRIDFVLYSGILPIAAKIAGENSTLSDIRFENYPSDHRAVVSTFKWHE
ncbi:MAG: endonuclease/exonuclease/phosphatase family protein [Bacteroidales bacterium]|jgi:endonuclease/exonuclease/phosphatase family metal-dependent hydrolase|nr:endonuclease/exonuclease/phosphatase family protein [Bacteroidales bacterium]